MCVFAKQRMNNEPLTIEFKKALKEPFANLASIEKAVKKNY